MIDRFLDSFSSISFQATAIAQMSSAAVSLVCSSTMTVTIARGENGLSIPYRRIIFGISISDVLQSLAFLLGPILVPIETPDCWGLGNKTSCRIQGSLCVFGFCLIIMYMSFLCFYYLCKLKYRMTNEEFAYKFERKLHSLVILVASSLAISALTADTIHPTFFRSTCTIAVTPVGCRINPEAFGECDPTIQSRVDILVFYAEGILIFSLLGIVIMMIMLYCHAINFHRIFRSDASGGDVEIEVNSNGDEDINSVDMASLHHQQQQQEAQNLPTHLSRVYRNEILLEATFYVVALCFTSVPYTSLYIMVKTGTVPPIYMQILAMSLSPLCGFFNILVYTRQQISCLRRHRPELPWLLCFWMVLKAGGEIPSNHGVIDSLPPGGAPHGLLQGESADSNRDSDQFFPLPSDFMSIPTPSLNFSAALDSPMNTFSTMVGNDPQTS